MFRILLFFSIILYSLKAAGQESRYEKGGQRFASQGPQPGEMFPENLKIYTLSGKEGRLSNLWAKRPGVLVTCSVTCPISIRTCPLFKNLAEEYVDKINFCLLYVNEAHPLEEKKATDERLVGAHSQPSPTSFDEKIKLAGLFEEEVNSGSNLVVDDLQGSVFKALEAGPNIGLLMNTNGKIVIRQGWFNYREMRKAIIQVLNAPNNKNLKQRFSRLLPEDVKAYRDLEYANVEGESLKLDLYIPEKADAPTPLMVWIHGGGWKKGDKARFNPAILRLSGEGYAVASINYRLYGLSSHPEQIHDCKGALRWLRSRASKYNYDTSRIAVGGGSAGGHLSLLLGLSSGVGELEGNVGGNTEYTGTVKAIIDFYGPSEFNEFKKQNKRFGQYQDVTTEQLLKASPLTYLTPDDPPVLIFHGDKDRTVPLEQSILVNERYQEMGLHSELYILEGAGHGGKKFSDSERYTIIKTFLDRALK